MTVTVIVHVLNDESILGEIDELPQPTDQIVVVNNPRRKDGKDLINLEEDVTTMIIPWHRINFVEIIPSDEIEEVITFVREQ